MKIFLVCESYCWSYEDHGWEVKKAFFAEDAAEAYCLQLEADNKDEGLDYYVDTVEVH